MSLPYGCCREGTIWKSSGRPSADGCRRALIADRWEWTATAALSAYLLVCQVVRAFSAGGLWRDEANSVYLAEVASLQENLEKLQFDSFPFGWFLILRSWVQVGLAGSDGGWRLFGVVVGTALIVSMWWGCRSWNSSSSLPSPLVAIFLAGFRPITIGVGGSVRAYGLGMCCTVLIIACTMRALRVGGAASWMRCAAVYGVSVHVMYHEAFVVFAVAVASAVVGAARRSFRQTCVPLLIGAAVAATMMVYLPVLRSIREWDDVLKQPVSVGRLATAWLDSLQVMSMELGKGQPAPNAVHRLVAAGIWGLVICSAAWLCWRPRDGGVASREQLGRPVPKHEMNRSWRADADQVLFIGVAALVFIPVYLGALYFQGWSPAGRYFMVATTFMAVMCDALMRVGISQLPRARVALAIGISALGLLTAAPLLNTALIRATNVDVAARLIRDKAQQGDLVLVSPWELGVSFSRYCGQDIRWTSLPPLSDNKVHRYDLFRAAVVDSAYAAPTCESIRSMVGPTGDVWYVGYDLRIARDDATGAVSLQGGGFTLHGISCLPPGFTRCEEVPVSAHRSVSESENVSIVVFRR